jgi:hypothetical protein
VNRKLQDPVVPRALALLKGGALGLLSPGMETGGWCCQKSQAESITSQVGTWPKSPMGEYMPQAHVQGPSCCLSQESFCFVCVPY